MLNTRAFIQGLSWLDSKRVSSISIISYYSYTNTW